MRAWGLTVLHMCLVTCLQFVVLCRPQYKDASNRILHSVEAFHISIPCINVLTNKYFAKLSTHKWYFLIVGT